MRNDVLRCAAIAAAVFGIASASSAAPIAGGDLVVYRVGDGAAANLANTGNPVFLDEYTPAGAFVQSIALPTTNSGSTHGVFASGTATSEGLISLSTDGRFVMATGYSATGATSIVASTAASNPRVVARVDLNGNIDTSTALTDFADTNNPRSVTSTDGTNIWVSGAAGGIRYTTLGSSTSTQLSTTVTNLRQTNIFGGQLYVSTSSGSAVRVGTVGSGTPTTSGQTITNLPGFPTTGSPYAFFFADLSQSVAGVDTVYVADDTPGQIQKFSLVGGSWTASGTITAAAVRGLTGVVNGTTVTLYGTTGASGAAGGGTIYSAIDTTGYNATASGTATSIATASANEAFRGIVLTPAVPEPASIGLLAAIACIGARRRMTR